MSKPDNYMAELTIGGSDSVDTFIDRFPNKQVAVDCIHTMLENWIEFDDMRRKNHQNNLDRAVTAEEKVKARLLDAQRKSRQYPGDPEYREGMTREVLKQAQLFLLASKAVTAAQDALSAGPPLQRGMRDNGL